MINVKNQYRCNIIIIKLQFVLDLFSKLKNFDDIVLRKKIFVINHFCCVTKYIKLNHYE